MEDLVVMLGVIIGCLGVTSTIIAENAKQKYANNSDVDSSSSADFVSSFMDENGSKETINSATAKQFVEIQQLTQRLSSQSIMDKPDASDESNTNKKIESIATSSKSNNDRPEAPSSLYSYFEKSYNEAIGKHSFFSEQQTDGNDSDIMTYLRRNKPTTYMKLKKTEAFAEHRRKHLQKERVKSWNQQIEELRKTHSSTLTRTANNQTQQPPFANANESILQEHRKDDNTVSIAEDLDFRYQQAVSKAKKYYEKLNTPEFKRTVENKQRLIEIAMTFNYLKIALVSGSMSHKKVEAAEQFALEVEKFFRSQMSATDKNFFSNSSEKTETERRSSSQVIMSNDSSSNEVVSDSNIELSIAFSPEIEQRNQRLVDLFQYIEQKKAKFAILELHQYETAQQDFIKLLEVFLKAEGEEQKLFEPVFTEGQELLISKLESLKSQLTEQLKQELEQRVEFIRERDN